MPEKADYDHAGIKNCLFDNSMPRTLDRISKARRALNAVASLGIKNGGVNMSTCSILCWSIIVPIVTYGSELWVLKGEEIEELRKFQRYIGRRCQRYPKRSPNYSAYTPLGWMSIDRYIQVKKLLFLRTILIAEENDICKRLLSTRTIDFANNLKAGRASENASPIFDLLNTSIQVDLYDTCMRMIVNGYYFSKQGWKEMVWKKVWFKEDDDCIIMYKQPHQNYLLFDITDTPYYLVWWIIADMFPRKTGMCEIMASLVCNTSLLKSSDYRIKKKSHSHKICTRCNLGIVEDIRHLLMQCPHFSQEMRYLYDFLNQARGDIAPRVANIPQNYFQIIMGKQPVYATFQDMVEIWLVTGECINKIYRCAIEGRT